jgi:hypothetical protein
MRRCVMGLLTEATCACRRRTFSEEDEVVDEIHYLLAWLVEHRGNGQASFDDSSERLQQAQRSGTVDSCSLARAEISHDQPYSAPSRDFIDL